MITTAAPSFYVLRANGEAAEMITSVFSPGVMSDIIEVVVVSRNYTNDIEPINELDESIETLKSGLGAEQIQNVVFNPLYIPMSIEELDEVLESDGKSETMRFSGMDGNPFAIKKINIGGDEDAPMITATVSYQQFDLPAYDVILDKQTNRLLN